MSYIYLASPYSANTQQKMDERYKIAQECVGEFTRGGVVMLSPVLHCHDLARRYELRTDYAFWRQLNEALIRAASELWVLCLPGWEDSLGVSSEIKFAKTLHKPIRYLNCIPPSFSFRDGVEIGPDI
ncbi:MAG: DUF1937 family protein [Acidobacteriota bacterium]